MNETLDERAVEMCARKVASVTGDIRKALDMCKLASSECCSQAATDATPTSSAPLTSLKRVTAAMKEIYGSKVDIVSTLPLHQKLVLLASLLQAELGVTSLSQNKVLFDFFNLFGFLLKWHNFCSCFAYIPTFARS